MKKSSVIMIVLIAVSLGMIMYQSGELGGTRELLASAVAESQQKKIDLDALKIRFEASQREILNTRDELSSTRTQLLSTEAELQDAGSSLAATQAYLSYTEAKLSSTANELSTAQGSLTDAHSQLTLTQSKLQSAEALNETMLDNYADLRETVNARWNWPENASNYITPEDPEIIAKAHYLAGGFVDEPEEYWKDDNRLYQWVASSIEYDGDSPVPILPSSLSGTVDWIAECWKTPGETLADLSGDCEDMATLLASLMLAYNEEKYAVWVIRIHNDEIGHMAVGFPVKGGNFSIADPAGHYFTGMNRWTSLGSDPVEKCINDWLDSLAREMPGASIDSVFSKDFFREFESTQEFIDWVTSR